MLTKGYTLPEAISVPETVSTWMNFRLQLIAKIQAGNAETDLFKNAVEAYQFGEDSEKIKLIFGEDCLVTLLESGNYDLNFRLKDGALVGGQKMNIEVKPSTKLTIDNGENNNWTIDVFESVETKINGKSINQLLPKIYYKTPDEQKIKILEEYGIPRYSVESFQDRGAAIVNGIPVIINSQMEYQEDWISMAHEVGHCNTFDTFNYSDFTSTRNRFEDNQLNDAESTQFYRQLLDIEALASIGGIKFLNQVNQIDMQHNVDWTSIYGYLEELFGTYIDKSSGKYRKIVGDQYILEVVQAFKKNMLLESRTQ